MRAWRSRLGWIALAACTAAAFAGDATLTRVREREWALAKGLVNDFYDVANGYFQSGYRREAAHFMQRCAELAPDNAFVASLARTLADFDHPLWKKRRWRSPKGAADEAFRRRAASMDVRYRKVLVAQGNASFDEKAESYKERAHGFYLKALRSLGGPFELDAKQQLKIDAAVIPAAASARLIDGELVEVNGALYFRDSMLRSLKDVAAVREARGERSLVRTLAGAGGAGEGTPEQLGAGLARLLDARNPRFAEPFERWESFALGSGAAPGGKPQSLASAELFDAAFSGRLPELEQALRKWLSAR